MSKKTDDFIGRKLEPHPIAYPKDYKIWDKHARQMEIINRPDLHEEELFKGLGITGSPLLSSFGVVDPEEIRGRQDVMRWLGENRKIESWFLKNTINFSLPRTEEKFLEYSDPSHASPYWSKIDELIDMINKSKSVPSRIRDLVDFLSGSIVLCSDEREMFSSMQSQLSSATVIEGLVDYAVSFSTKYPDSAVTINSIYAPEELEIISSHTHGFKRYSYSINDAAKHTEPEWTHNKWLRGVRWLCQTVNNARNYFETKRAYRGETIKSIPKCLTEDLEKGICKALEFDWRGIEFENRRKARLGGSKNLILRVYYNYSSNGLQVKIYGIEDDIEASKSNFEFNQYGNFPLRQVIKIKRGLRKYINRSAAYAQAIWNADLMLEIKKRSKNSDFFLYPTRMPSPETDTEYRWYAIQNLYVDPSVIDVYNASLKHRKFLAEHISVLKNMSEISQQIRIAAKRIHAKTCIPEILDKDHIVKFKELYPVHLLANPENKEIVPVTDMSLNGDMICLTGKNNGGKTTFLLSVVAAIFMAQSGIPIIGWDFSLNPKEILGLAFIERGDASICTLLVQKIKNILAATVGIPGNKVVLVLDEVGGATQETFGLKFGKKVLEKIAEQGDSTVFATQIGDLATIVQNEMGGDCYQFMAGHKMVPGIGDGDMDSLCREIGITEFLHTETPRP